MSEEGKVRLMVIPIVAMLAVTMIIAGYYQEEEQEIEVEEGYDEMSFEYIDMDDLPGYTGYINKTTNVTTYIEDTTHIEESKLEFEVIASGMSVEKYGGYYMINIFLDAEGEFTKNLSPESFQFRAEQLIDEDIKQEVDDLPKLEFHGSETAIDNGTSSGTQKTWVKGEGEASWGFDLQDEDFKSETMIRWFIPLGSESPYTIEFKAVVGGFSEEVKSTIHTHIEVPEGGV